jgi:Cu(I)/Ag(I) efflux system membrane fusion protein/cobalt-zinc-cadmium efflux system membrane fusion protein
MMRQSSHLSLLGGVFCGIILALLVAGVFHLQGYRFMRHDVDAPPGKMDRQILCYKSPQDPSFMSDKAGKDPQGNDLVPVYAEAPSSTPASQPKGDRKIKYWISPMDPGYVRDKPGKAPCGMDLVPVYEDEPVSQASAPKGERKIKYWISPMDPGYVRDKPGKAPCGMDLVPVYEDTEPEKSAAGTITISPNILQSMGVRTAKVQVQPLSRTIRAVSRVMFNERQLTQVSTKINGWVDKLHVRATGDPIRKGQVLLSIYSPELVSTQQEYLLALKNWRTMEKSSFPELKEGAQRLLEASRQRLRFWDVPAAQIETLERTGEIKKNLPLNSPVNGIVTKREVTEGQYITAGQTLLEVADLNNVWVEADVYEYELPWIKVGQPAIMTLTYLPGETFHGRVQYIYPYMSGATRTARVRLDFSNTKLRLKPDMYAQVEIKASMGQATPVIPSEAVLDTGEKQHVFISLGQGRFEPREIKLGLQSNDDRRQVLSGLKGGEEVVTSAQFLLDSESRFREAIALMLGDKDGKKKEPTPPAMPGHQHH